MRPKATDSCQLRWSMDSVQGEEGHTKGWIRFNFDYAYSPKPGQKQKEVPDKIFEQIDSQCGEILDALLSSKGIVVEGDSILVDPKMKVVDLVRVLEGAFKKSVKQGAILTDNNSGVFLMSLDQDVIYSKERTAYVTSPAGFGIQEKTYNQRLQLTVGDEYIQHAKSVEPTRRKSV